MVIAIVKKGVIVPKEPLPSDWTDGVEVEVERSTSVDGAIALDQWFEELEASASQMSTEDDQTLRAAIEEVRRQEKELARKQLEINE